MLAGGCTRTRLGNIFAATCYSIALALGVVGAIVIGTVLLKETVKAFVRWSQ